VSGFPTFEPGKRRAILTDPEPERNFRFEAEKRKWPFGGLCGFRQWPRVASCLSLQGARLCGFAKRGALAWSVIMLTPALCAAQPLVMLVQPPVWAEEAKRFDARPFAEHLSRALGRSVVVRRSDDVLSHWRAVRSGRGFDMAFDEAPFTAWRISHRGFTVLAQVVQERRFAIVVRPRTLITSPSDLGARRVAVPPPPSLAALRLLNLFPDPVQAPVLVPVVARERALRALSTGQVSAIVLPIDAIAASPDLQIALETDASPGRAFSVSTSISSTQRRALLGLFARLATSAAGLRVFSQLAVERLQPVSNSVYEDAERLLKGTWGYKKDSN
jgi:ABC-type phosphate/phosphonate transport system substrate-binding protein